MVPDVTKTAASLPRRSATRFSRAFTVGSSPKTSSPTAAVAIACRMGSVGFVTVSERMSTSLLAFISAWLLPLLV